MARHNILIDKILKPFNKIKLFGKDYVKSF